MKTETELKALHLYRSGDHAILKMEISKGVWVTLIKETIDSPFSHIIEPLGIQRAIEGYEHPDQQQYSEDDI